MAKLLLISKEAGQSYLLNYTKSSLQNVMEMNMELCLLFYPAAPEAGRRYCSPSSEMRVVLTLLIISLKHQCSRQKLSSEIEAFYQTVSMTVCLALQLSKQFHHRAVCGCLPNALLCKRKELGVALHV